MYLFALPLRAIFAADVVEAIEQAIAEHIRRALDERERQDEADTWMTPAQLGEVLGISAEAVRKRVARGRIESRHHGRRLLVRLGGG